ISLFRRGIWVSWGSGPMTVWWSRVYKLGYILISVGVALILVAHGAAPSQRLKTDVENARLKGSLSSPRLSRIALDRELAVEYASVSRGFYEKRVDRHN